MHLKRKLLSEVSYMFSQRNVTGKYAAQIFTRGEAIYKGHSCMTHSVVIFNFIVIYYVK